MSKKFVLDTNILLLDYRAMFKFEENEVHIPMIVLEELDTFKKDMGEKGFNARETARYLDKLSKRGLLTNGVDLDNGGKLFVSVTDSRNFAPENLNQSINDNIIITHAIERNAILVSNDINVRLKARAAGLIAEVYEPAEVRNRDEEYKGHQDIQLTGEQAEELKTNKSVKVDEQFDLHANEYANVTALMGGTNRLCTYDQENDLLVPIKEYKQVLGLTPKNKEQRFAIDALMNPDIKLVTLQGKAGTGKTLLAVAAALSQVLEGGYTKLSISRPIQPMGKDLGYLPGTVEEKLMPWMKPIFDNIEFLLKENPTGNKKKGEQQDVYSVDAMMKADILEMEAITYIRGRSMPNQIIIVDEAQNLSAHEIKTILTRAGEGTKIILTGDVEQIDTPYLDHLNNGFAYVIDKFKDEAIAAHIRLEKGERSILAELASKIL